MKLIVADHHVSKAAFVRQITAAVLKVVTAADDMQCRVLAQSLACDFTACLLHVKLASQALVCSSMHHITSRCNHYVHVKLNGLHTKLTITLAVPGGFRSNFDRSLQQLLHDAMLCKTNKN